MAVLIAKEEVRPTSSGPVCNLVQVGSALLCCRVSVSRLSGDLHLVSLSRSQKEAFIQISILSL